MDSVLINKHEHDRIFSGWRYEQIEDEDHKIEHFHMLKWLLMISPQMSTSAEHQWLESSLCEKTTDSVIVWSHRQVLWDGFFCVLWKIASLRDVKSRPEGGCQMESCGFSKFFLNFRWIFSELVQWFYLKRTFRTIELSNELFLHSSLLWFVMCFSGSHGSRVSSGMVYKISIEKRSSWLSCGAETRWVAVYETSLETLQKKRC